MSDFFTIAEPLRYEGHGSRNPAAFHWYDANQVVMGKRMEDHLRFAVAYWHSLCWPGSDPFGGDTFQRPWMAGGDTMEGARQKAEVAFERFRLLDVPFFCFHDRDIAPEGGSLAETNRNTRAIAELLGRNVTDALQQIALNHRLPVIHQVLSCKDEEQARVRCIDPTYNRGTEAARAAVTMSNLLAQLRE